MNTNLLYLSDAYLASTHATVQEVLADQKSTAVTLDQTIFYPQGGGQPADQGVIVGPRGRMTISHVSYNGGDVLHKGKVVGNIQRGDTVTLELNWVMRFKHMQQHTAGHIVDQAVKNVLPTAQSVDGNHGIGKQMFVEFTTPIPAELKSKIEEAAQAIIAANLPITTEMITHAELLARQIKLPFDLPTNKPLRIVQIGEYPAMPDGGTQLRLTGECSPISIPQIIEHEGKYRVVYTLFSPENAAHTSQQKTQHAAAQPSTQTKETMTSSSQTPANDHVKTNTQEAGGLSSLTAQLEEIKTTFATDIINPALKTPDLKTKYLGKKGLFNTLAQVLREIEPAARKDAGQLLNTVKTQLEEQLTNRTVGAATTSQWVDVTMPGTQPKVGHMHPVSQAMEEITHIFEQIGFTRLRYPEVDWDYYVFESLNMPPDHPARDEWETFFVDAPIDQKMGKMMLTTQTSNGQVREMERLNSQPPIRMINIGRCYRRQQDATHTQMFHQFEGLVVDKGINIQHLKGTLDYFAEQFYGPGTKSRIRPFHFRFTEPSFEVDFSCHICHGTGFIESAAGKERVKCKFCKSGWHEVGGAGMVHPNVLKAGGIDADVYSGFAFGWGIERTYTLKQGLNIDDIRLLYSGDARFLSQF